MLARGRPKLGAVAPSDLGDLLALWNRAVTSPRGIVIESQRPNALLQKLYAARRETGGFHDLRLVETPTAVWIIKKEPE